MYKVVEMFSGIGSQAKALKNIGIEHEIIAVVEWDINAICAYDAIHSDALNDLTPKGISKKELVEELSEFTLSSDGKKPLTKMSLAHMSMEALKRVYSSIKRTNNLVSIMDVEGDSLPNEIDILTYSFPCQDLSICGFWHGNISGIDRKAMNRSGMLWEVERILMERVESRLSLPRFLLMENVSNILSPTHRENFEEWKKYLDSIGYYNKIYTLNAKNFGIPQNRERVFMISFLKEGVNNEVFEKYFCDNNLELLRSNLNSNNVCILEKFLKVDYNNPIYFEEAARSQTNFTPSREKIYNTSNIIYKSGIVVNDVVTTITTKQDRKPNSGILEFDPVSEGKSPYRNLTPRECFMLMGFEESDFDKMMSKDFMTNKSRNFFTDGKLLKMAGNSIVVQVLEKIFEQINEIDIIITEQREEKKYSKVI